MNGFTSALREFPWMASTAAHRMVGFAGDHLVPLGVAAVGVLVAVAAWVFYRAEDAHSRRSPER